MMKPAIEKKLLSYWLIYLPAGLAILGSLALILLHFFYKDASLPLVPGLVVGYINVPLDIIPMGFAQFTLETQNYLLFQVFESLPPVGFPRIVQGIGILFWVLFSLGVTLITGFRRYPFVIGMGVAIFLLVVSGINALNIGGVHSNTGLIIAFSGLLLPALLIHTFFSNLPFGKRSLLIFAFSAGTWALLIYLSPETAPTLLLAENSSLLALSIAALFLAYIGHAVISAFYVLLAKLNRGMGIKIVWHFCILSLLYLIMVALIFLRMMGELNLGIPLPPVFVLFIVVSLLGYVETHHKILHMAQPYASPMIGRGLYAIGFAFTAWVWFKADLTANTPMSDFLQHVFIYFQLGFGLLFFLYLIANFLGIINSGTAIDKIMYRPPFFPYYHMRLGALLSVLVLIIYADIILLTQWNTASINLSADYYYAIGRNREAAILYENSFERYRHNPKTLNAVAHISFEQRQPTPGLNALTRSFDERPNVADIILLASKLHGSGKTSDALFYLQEGLKYFPENPYLLNNLAILNKQLNQATVALDLLERMPSETSIRDANLIALETVHQLGIPLTEVKDNLIGNVNLLANYNLKGDLAPFSLPTDTIQDGSLLNRAILRNQWSNAPQDGLREDMAQIDSIVEKISIPSLAAELGETRAVRAYQKKQINEVLATLGNLAYNFSGSAGFYRSFEALVFMSQMDLEKAAEAWVMAEENGFSNLQKDHLAILYFGGKEVDADIIAQKYHLSYPDWMKWGSDGRFLENDTIHLVRGLGRMLPGLGPDALLPLEKIQNPKLKAFYAHQLLLRKAHWFGEADLTRIGKAIADEYSGEREKTHIQNLVEAAQHGKITDESASNPFLPQVYSDDPKNAYLTPWVMARVNATEENLEKYNILHDASRSNKDPLLWIELVRYSRILGLDSYASSYLAEMAEWIDSDDLIELQLRYF